MQDFKDIAGDELIGRRTLPIVYPRGCRVLTALLIPLWSIIATEVWEANRELSITTVMLSLYIGWRILLWRTVESDRRSYLWYNVRHQ